MDLLFFFIVNFVVIGIAVWHILSRVERGKSLWTEVNRDPSKYFGSDFHKLCFFDLETTGLNPRADRVIEFCFAKFEKNNDGIGHEVRTLCGLVNPAGREVHPAAYNLHGISDSLLKKQRFFSEHLKDILIFVGDRQLIAHNASFDQSFLWEEFKRCGVEFHYVVFDSIVLISKKHPSLNSYSLKSLKRKFKVGYWDAHRASGDVMALLEVLAYSKALVAVSKKMKKPKYSK